MRIFHRGGEDKIRCPCRESKCGRPVHCSSLYWLSYLDQLHTLRSKRGGIELFTLPNDIPVRKATFKWTASARRLSALNSRSWNPGGCFDGTPAGGSTDRGILSDTACPGQRSLRLNINVCLRQGTDIIWRVYEVRLLKLLPEEIQIGSLLQRFKSVSLHCTSFTVSTE
jgi:hypothetical protein